MVRSGRFWSDRQAYDGFHKLIPHDPSAFFLTTPAQSGKQRLEAPWQCNVRDVRDEVEQENSDLGQQASQMSFMEEEDEDMMVRIRDRLQITHLLNT